VQFCWSQTSGQTQVAGILHRPGRASGAIIVFNFLVHFINKKRKTGIFRWRDQYLEPDKRFQKKTGSACRSRCRSFDV